jgi:hypothetical protein
MTLGAEEFLRRFLLHVLPAGFHRIRHYGLIANSARRENLAKSYVPLTPLWSCMKIQERVAPKTQAFPRHNQLSNIQTLPI